MRLHSAGPWLAENALNVFVNFTVIPLMFWMFSDDIGHFLLDVPTWSLGLEAAFIPCCPGY
jgi:hypothetical protein